MDDDLKQILNTESQINKKVDAKNKEEILKEYDGKDKIVKAKQIYQNMKASGIDEVRFGVKTGFKLIDQALTNPYKNAKGIMSEDLCIITGHTGNGKTTLISTLRRNILRQGHYSMLFSFENSIESIVRTWKPNDPNMSDYIDFYCPQNIDETDGQWLKDRMLEGVLKYPHINVIFIDHLDYIYDVERGQSEEQAIRNTVRFLTVFARKHHVIIFLIAHPSNKVEEEREVQLNHLKGSSSIKQFASQVLVVNKDEFNNSTLKLKKNRWGGRLESMKMTYIPETDMLIGNGKVEMIKESKINFGSNDI